MYGGRKQSPKVLIREKDKRRAAWHRFYTDEKWGNVANYHIFPDSGLLGIGRLRNYFGCCTEKNCTGIIDIK